MVKHPVDTEKFWKERIDRADKDGIENYSVYLVSPHEWQKIAARHKAILNKIPELQRSSMPAVGTVERVHGLKLRITPE